MLESNELLLEIENCSQGSSTADVGQITKKIIILKDGGIHEDFFQRLRTLWLSRFRLTRENSKSRNPPHPHKKRTNGAAARLWSFYRCPSFYRPPRSSSLPSPRSMAQFCRWCPATLTYIVTSVSSTCFSVTSRYHIPTMMALSRSLPVCWTSPFKSRKFDKT